MKIYFFWARYYNSTGDSILLNISKYIDHFVYPIDYFYFNIISVNKILYSNNITNNIHEIYKNDDFVEFHDSNYKNSDYLDRYCIRLVFRREKAKLFLTGVISDKLIR